MTSKPRSACAVSNPPRSPFSRLQARPTEFSAQSADLSRQFGSRTTLLLVSLFIAGIAAAQTRPGIDVEYLTRQGVDERLQPDGVDLLGDQIDMNTGSVVFRHTDVSLPGNSDLEVAVHRRRTGPRRYPLIDDYEFADWEIEAPKMTIIVPQLRDGASLDPPEWKDDRCTGTLVLGPRMILDGEDPWIGESYILEDYEYSNGLMLEIPGKGSRQVLDIGAAGQWPSGTEKVTSDNWAISCIADIGAGNGGGQGFIATAPNGDQYRFDKLIFRRAPVLKFADRFLERSFAMMLATEVTDVNGNWVRYDYTSGGALTRIHSNDGREIDVSYANGVIDQVIANPNTADERIWNYTYVSGPSISTKLTTVTLPDGRTWSFDLNKMDDGADPTYNCTQADTAVSVTHPNGATGTFTFSETRHLKGNQNGKNTKSRGCQTVAEKKPYFDAMSLTEKTLSGPGYPTATWTYAYSGYSGGTIPSTKWGQVIDPLGRKIVHTFDRASNIESLPTKVEVFATAGSPTPIETTNYTYVVESSVGTTFLQNENQAKLAQPRHEEDTVITRGSDTFTTARQYDTNQASSSYSHGFPTQVVKSTSTIAATRVVDTVYSHKRTKWVLGLPATVTRNGKLFDSFTYDSLGRLKQHDAFGNLFRKVGYHTASGQQGAVAWVEDGLPTPRRTSFNNYKRGLPQQIVRADSSTLGRVVDNNGWVTQETNGNGVQTNYQYNDVGWLTLINRPLPWSDTSISYTAAGSGITQVSTRGTTKITRSYDSLTRPFLVKTEATSGGGATSYVATNYDALGKVTFTSFPSSSSSPSDGTSTVYDALGRPESVSENVSPFATTSYTYLSSNRTQTTDPEGAVTIHHYHAFGSPADGELHRIEQPMNVDTYIYYNDYGQQTRVQQAGNHNGYSLDQSQYFYYDASQRLCRQWTPEGGYTAFGYNAANELTSYAKGHSGGSSCAAPSGNSLVTLTYDDLGRLKTTDFQDSGTPDISRTYDDNSNLLTLNRGGVNWTYTYDTADNLKTEQLDIDGRNYDLAYDYNADGHLFERTLPSGAVIDYTLNGLGQPSSVENGATVYADNLVYHPNENLESANYGNGHSLQVTWTPRQQPLRKYVHLGGSDIAVDRTYGYNARGQIINITDAADTGNNRAYDYDDLGRLISASGPWGSGSFTYDPLANLRAKMLGARTVTVSYDAVTNRATQSTDTAGPTRSIGYDGRGNVATLGAMTFVYDMSDQPVSQSGSVATTYTYDGNLKRAKQVIAGKAIYSVYDASGEMVHRDNVTDNKVTEYVAAAGATVRIENGAPRYTFKDHLGSPIAGTDNSAPVTWRERYTPYGEKLLDPAANKDEPAYTGHIQDSATGLIYMQARYYDPVIGRFLSIDPAEFAAERPFMFNRYAYAGNDPTNLTDPTGRCPWCLGAFVGAVLETGAQLIQNGGDISKLNGAKILAAGAAGATGVGLSRGIARIGTAATSRIVASNGGTKVAANVALNTAGNAAAGAAISVGQNAANNAVDGQQLLEGAGDAATAGAIAGGLGTLGESGLNAVAKGSQNLANATGSIIVDSAGVATAPATSTGLATGVGLTLSNGAAAVEAVACTADSRRSEC